jgi:hypothetical protein
MRKYPEVLEQLSDMGIDLVEDAGSSLRNEPAALIVPGLKRAARHRQEFAREALLNPTPNRLSSASLTA